MPSTRRSLLVAATSAAVAGCFESSDDDPMATESPQYALRLDPATADEIGPDDDVGILGETFSKVLSDLTALVETEPWPVVIGGRIRARGQSHGAEPPLEPFDTIAVGGSNLAIDIESAPPYTLAHTAESVDDVPADAPVIDTTDHPDQVVNPIVEVIDTGRESIHGWSAAFQLLDDNAHEGGGFDDMTAYVRHDGETYRIDRYPGTPHPYPGYAFVIRATPHDAEPEATLSRFDPGHSVRNELDTAIENGAVGDAGDETVVAVEGYDYLLSDYGFFEVTVRTE